MKSFVDITIGNTVFYFNISELTVKKCKIKKINKVQCPTYVDWFELYNGEVTLPEGVTLSRSTFASKGVYYTDTYVFEVDCSKIGFYMSEDLAKTEPQTLYSVDKVYGISTSELTAKSLINAEIDKKIAKLESKKLR